MQDFHTVTMSVSIFTRIFFSNLSVRNTCKTLSSNHGKTPKKLPPRKKKDTKSQEVADSFSNIREGLKMLQQFVKRVQSYGGFGKKMRHAQLKKKRLRRMVKGNKKK